MKLAWSKKLSVGNSIIDAEHRNLFSMANDLAVAITARNHTVVAQEFELFENWLAVHFENEEWIAQVVDIDFALHKLVHQHLLKELQHLKGELEAKNGAWSDSETNNYFDLLRKLLIDHVSNDDMQMQQVLQNYPYNFMHG